jgi:hypothetical protein
MLIGFLIGTHSKQDLVRTHFFSYTHLGGIRYLATLFSHIDLMNTRYGPPVVQ